MKRRGGRVRKSGASRMRGVGVGGRRMCLPAVTPGDSAGGGETADSRKSYTLGCISTFLCTVQAPIDSVKYMGIPNGIDQIRRHKLNAAEIKGMSGAQRCPERDIYAADFHLIFGEDSLRALVFSRKVDGPGISTEVIAIYDLSDDWTIQKRGGPVIARIDVADSEARMPSILLALGQRQRREYTVSFLGGDARIFGWDGWQDDATGIKVVVGDFKKISI
ncbi:hypothetical protein B0H14DRAFT_2593881 [Mycena olivaceomarginata]|nr:hypothetical protein B0H14DRAFT_2593881 [Mycena olivaceomarginata]